MASASTQKTARQRVPASERRDALIEAAIPEFAAGGFHGTPVDRIARRVGVAQPYVFSLFGSKRELFLAAVDRCFARVTELLTRGAEEFDPTIAAEDATIFRAMGNAYTLALAEERELLMLQMQAYAACEDPVIRDHVRRGYARLVRHAERLAGDAATQEQLDEFFRYGMWLNVAAAMGVEDLSAGCAWIREELGAEPDATPHELKPRSGG
ncbi:MAG TPA: TetR/AcrR family transcriptional regulator [Solirubrobacteraceae bacterium]|nr:TetR/AcrR family transcriptional regulator [Solirubrobacteraceae bacterium]